MNGSARVIVLALSILGCDPKPDPAAVPKTITSLRSAQQEFREKDLDQNGIQDYWTGDLTRLFDLGLIPREIAEADAAPIRPIVDRPKPYHGYFFVTLKQDLSPGKPTELMQDTDGKNGKVHHRTMWGICAYPSEATKPPKRTYLWCTGSEWTGLLGRYEDKPGPVRDWPAKKERIEDWAVID
jgi:hypothetical protein